MSFLPRRLLARKVEVSLRAWPRIIPGIHVATPTGAGFGPSRFSSESWNFRVLYAAEDFSTAFAEAVVRDRFEGRQRRYLYQPYLETLMATEISSTLLRLLDVTGPSTYEMGIDTDIGRARTHVPSREFAAALHAHSADFDGILFSSRLTDSRCVAIFGRAFARLSATRPVPLVRVAALPGELRRLDIIVRRRRTL